MPTAAAVPDLPATSFTATRMASVICEADGLPPEARLSVERKLRRLATGRQLQDGEQIPAARAGARGKDIWIFPTRELYRARLLLEFAALGIDVDHAEAALRLVAFALRRHEDCATTGIDAILDAARATVLPLRLDVVRHPIEGNLGTCAYLNAPLMRDERSRVSIDVGQMVRRLDSALATER